MGMLRSPAGKRLGKEERRETTGVTAILVIADCGEMPDKKPGMEAGDLRPGKSGAEHRAQSTAQSGLVVRGVLIAMGFTEVGAQVVLLRELLVTFHGNELVVGLAVDP